MYLAKYLLSIEEFMDKEKGEALVERAFSCVDDTRRRKAERIKPGRARAASLGAGLLLQAAVREAVCAFGGSGGGWEIGKAGDTAETKWENAVWESCAFGGNVSGQEACVSGCNGWIAERAADLGGGTGDNAVKEMVPHGGNAGGQKAETQKAEISEDAALQMYGLKRYSVTQLLTCIEKESRLPFTYEYGEMGKPCFQGYPFHFSLSHSGEYVLCALSDAEIGADIQQHCGKDVGKLARRFYSPREAAAIEQAGAAGEQPFYRLWARKEAYGKLTGKGVAEVLSVDLLPEPEAASEKENVFEDADALPKVAGGLTEPILSEKRNLPSESILPKATGFLSETILSGGERLIWEEYSSEKDYSIALCRYG